MVIALGRTEEPEIVFAESVGSCTDLVATVAKPFALRNDNVRVVISVFADACLMHSIMKGTSCFIEEAVQYIYRKQLEEADIIVINKTDLVTPDELEYVTGIIETTYPGKRIFYMNAFNEMDVRNWIQLLETVGIPSRRQSLNLDYDLYGAGEAALAWLDQKISLHTHKLVAISTALMLADNIYDRIMKAGRTIGHLKFLLSDDWWHKKISYTTNAVKEDHIDGDSHLCNHVDILINARVQTDPRELQQIVALAIEETMTETGCRIVTHKLSAFQPGYPRPLHRISTV
jgi:G3E family GTPase